MMTLYVILLGIVALFAEMMLPEAQAVVRFSWVFLPMVVIFGALYSTGVWIFLATIVLGLLTNLLTPNGGSTVLNLSLLAALVSTQRIAPWSRNWAYQALLVLAGTFLFVGIDYLFYSWQMRRWEWPFEVWIKMSLCAVGPAILTPPSFWLLRLIPKASGWLPRPAEVHYARR